jgi:hypothetical protein
MCRGILKEEATADAKVRKRAATANNPEQSQMAYSREIPPRRYNSNRHKLAPRVASPSSVNLCRKFYHQTRYKKELKSVKEQYQNIMKSEQEVRVLEV